MSTNTETMKAAWVAASNEDRWAFLDWLVSEGQAEQASPFTWYVRPDEPYRPPESQS